MIFEKSSLKMKNLIVQIMLIRADFEWKLFFQMPLKNFYTSYDHNQGIHKVCLTSLIMSVKKLESYDMSNAIYLEKRVGGEKPFPPVSNIHLSSYDVIKVYSFLVVFKWCKSCYSCLKLIQHWRQVLFEVTLGVQWYLESHIWRKVPIKEKFMSILVNPRIS